MKAQEVHSILRETLTPALHANAFIPVTKGKKAWYREGNKFQIVKFQLDQHFGYIPLLGGRLFLRAWLSEILHDQPEGSVRPWTPMELMPTAVRAEMNELKNRVLHKLIRQDWDTLLGTLADAHARALLLKARSDLSASLTTRFDETQRLDAMSYLDADDVYLWGKFLATSIPSVVESLNQRDRSQRTEG